LEFGPHLGPPDVWPLTPQLVFDRIKSRFEKSLWEIVLVLGFSEPFEDEDDSIPTGFQTGF